MKIQNKECNNIRRELHHILADLIAKSTKSQVEIGDILGCAQSYVSNIKRHNYECSLELLLFYMHRIKTHVHIKQTKNKYTLTLEFPPKI